MITTHGQVSADLPSGLFATDARTGIRSETLITLRMEKDFVLGDHNPDVGG
jgi:hypothetical protein